MVAPATSFSFSIPPIYGANLPVEPLFAPFILIEYQSNRRMRGLMPEKNTDGSTAQIQYRTPSVAMTEGTFSTGDIATSEADLDNVVTNPRLFQLKMALARSQRSLINIDYVGMLAQIHGLAAGRQVDKVQIDGIFSNALYPFESAFAQVPTTIGLNTGLNVSKILGANTAADNFAVPPQYRVMVFNSNQGPVLAQDNDYKNSLISNMYPLKDGISAYMKPYLNTEFIGLARNSSNALPWHIAAYTPPGSETPTTAEFSWAVFIQHDSMTLNFNQNIETSMWYDGANKRDFVITDFIANANVMQAPGVVLVPLVLDAVSQQAFPNVAPNGTPLLLSDKALAFNQKALADFVSKCKPGIDPSTNERRFAVTGKPYQMRKL